MSKVTTNGVPVEIEWHKFVVGSSFYIPTLDPQDVADQVRKVAKGMGMDIKWKRTSERGTIGLRIWRTE